MKNLVETTIEEQKYVIGCEDIDSYVVLETNVEEQVSEHVPLLTFVEHDLFDKLLDEASEEGGTVDNILNSILEEHFRRVEQKVVSELMSVEGATEALVSEYIDETISFAELSSNTSYAEDFKLWLNEMTSED